MTTAVLTHELCQQHLTPAEHPESPQRIAAVTNALAESPELPQPEIISTLSWSRQWLREIHSQAVIDSVNQPLADDTLASIDEDTFLSPHSLRSVEKSCETLLFAADSVLSGKHSNAFCLVRPPGHHAERERSMGFCLYNQIALTAWYLLEQKGLRRIAIVDFDVHHGNGTEDIFKDDPRVLFCSLYQENLYPFKAGQNNSHCLNIPLKAGTVGSQYQKTFEQKVLPRLDDFKPEFILLSAGFDAHEKDPLAQLCLQAEDYFWLTQRLCEAADKHSDGRLISCLEGGYNLPALGRSAVQHVHALANK